MLTILIVFHCSPIILICSSLSVNERWSSFSLSFRRCCIWSSERSSSSFIWHSNSRSIMAKYVLWWWFRHPFWWLSLFHWRPGRVLLRYWGRISYGRSCTDLYCARLDWQNCSCLCLFASHSGSPSQSWRRLLRSSVNN